MTLREAAARYDTPYTTLHSAIKRGKLKAKKFGRDWQITPAAVERWRDKAQHSPGPPPKPKPDGPKRRPGRPRKEETASE